MIISKCTWCKGHGLVRHLGLDNSEDVEECPECITHLDLQNARYKLEPQFTERALWGCYEDGILTREELGNWVLAHLNQEGDPNRGFAIARALHDAKTGPHIVIVSRSRANKLLKHGGGYGSVLSISSVSYDPGANKPPYWVRQFNGPCLTLFFDDDYKSPTTDAINRIISFAHRVRTEQAWPLLIHCTAGISRSSASAVIVAGTLDEDHTPDLEALLDPSQHYPNRFMLELADQALELPHDEGLEQQAFDWRENHGYSGWENF